MRAIKRFVILALAVCMLWGMTTSAMAAETGETSTFTFSNEGTSGGSGTTGGTGTTGTTGGTGTTGSTGSSGTGSTGSTGSSGTGSTGSTGSSGTGSAKTDDVNTGAYAATAAIAGAGVAVILGVTLSRKRRYGKEGK